MPTPFDECLAEAVVEKAITQAQADRFRKAFAEAEDELRRLGRGAPDANELGARAIKRMMERVGQRKVDQAHKILGFNANVAAVKATQTVKVPKAVAKVFGQVSSVYRGLEALLGERNRGWGTEFSLVEQQKAAKLVMDATLDKFLSDVRSTALGLKRNYAAAIDTAREVMGHDTGNVTAKAHAKAWKDSNDWAVEALRELGVPIRAIQNYLPQNWSAGKLAQMGKENFVEAMMDRWRRGQAKFRDFNAEEPLYFIPGEDDARVHEILAGKGDKPGMYDNIVSNGDAGIEVGMPKGESIADRYNRRRVVEWANDQAYLDFLDTFGNGRERLGEDMVRHKNHMANDIGMARVLGNRPEERVKMLMEWGAKSGQLTEGQKRALEKTWYHASGQANAPTNVAIANTAQAVRLWLTGAQLHSAALGSAPDYAFLKSVATFNGLDSVRMMARYLEGPISARNARRLGLDVQEGIRGMRDHAGEQFTMNGAATIAGHAAEAVMRGTGLDAHTVMGRTALGREFLATLADVAEKSWTDLPPLNRHFLERYAIGSGEWDILRTKAMGGERLYMDPATLARESKGAERTAALKLLGAVDAESAHGMHEGGVATRAMLLGTSRPGEYFGELLRSFQYKGFSASVMLKSGWRMFDALFDETGTIPRGRYIAGLAIQATLLGAFSLQLKNLVQGKDLESMETASFWGKAAAQGGAGGMLGDYVKTMWQTRSADDAARLLTPTAGLMVDSYALATGNAAQWWEGDKTNFGREAARYGKKYLFPRFWMTNLAVDRMAWDTLQRAADPAASQSFYRLQQKLQKETGQHYFSPPGSDFTDMRMPEYSSPRRP